MKRHVFNFVDFLRSRGIMGFAIGFILGRATSDLIGSFVNDILNPTIGVLTGNFKNLSNESLTVGGATLKYGNFIVIFINFLILTLVIYVLFKGLRIEKLDKQP